VKKRRRVRRGQQRRVYSAKNLGLKDIERKVVEIKRKNCRLKGGFPKEF
jgi:hypothetical protein